MKHGLIAICIAQFAAIGVLAWQLHKPGDDSDMLTPAETPKAVESNVMAQAPTLPSAANDGLPYAGPSLEQIQLVVREELKRAVADLSRLEQSSAVATSADGQNAPTALDAVEQQYLTDTLHEDLDFYISQGQINDAEMASLQQTLALLDSNRRTEILRRITRAMNSGDLDARL